MLHQPKTDGVGARQEGRKSTKVEKVGCFDCIRAAEIETLQNQDSKKKTPEE
jgi:hypothetical protein